MGFSAMQRDDAFHYLALKRVPGLGNVTARRLLETFREAGAIFASPRQELLKVKGVRPQVIDALLSFRDEGSIVREMEVVAKSAVSLVCWHHEDYPQLLKTIYDPPPVLYVKGALRPEDEKAVAVVGTRTPTQYGREMTRNLCRELARQGVTVVSGLARGIDSAAHEATLEGGGRTVAVLGCGIDVVYPPENRRLYAAIAARGAVISEFPPGVKPESHHFPVRNRLISGMSLGVVVMEAAEKSGSLITSRLAAEQGREVFAVPGPLSSPKSKGTNALIRSGAKLVSGVEDILEELGQCTAANRAEGKSVEPDDFTDRERTILNLLGPEPVHFDELVRASGMSVPEVSGIVLMLLLKGGLYELSGKQYVKKMGS